MDQNRSGGRYGRSSQAQKHRYDPRKREWKPRVGQIVWSKTHYLSNAAERGKWKQNRIRPPAQTTTAGMRDSRRWVSHAARRFRTGAGGMRQIEPRREEASPDSDILEITTPETLGHEIASSARQTADPRSPPVAMQTELEMMINELGRMIPVEDTISA